MKISVHFFPHQSLKPFHGPLLKYLYDALFITFYHIATGKNMYFVLILCDKITQINMYTVCIERKDGNAWDPKSEKGEISLYSTSHVSQYMGGCTTSFHCNCSCKPFVLSLPALHI